VLVLRIRSSPALKVPVMVMVPPAVLVVIPSQRFVFFLFQFYFPSDTAGAHR
jgi:hypothetical protein